MLAAQYHDAARAYGREGIDRFAAAHGAQPTPSHICFKFTSIESYRAYGAQAESLSAVSRQIFGGKEITWCRLHEPVIHDGVAFEWLELVEPKDEAHPYDGVSSIGYAAPELTQVVKIAASNPRITFRYQARHAAQLAAE